MKRALFWLALIGAFVWLARPEKCERKCSPECAHRHGCDGQ